MQVHRELGPGLLESVYRACLLYELRERALAVIAEQLLPICYRGVIIEGAYRLDLLVEDQIVDFHVPVLVAGVDRVMNGRYEDALRTKTAVRENQENPQL